MRTPIEIQKEIDEVHEKHKALIAEKREANAYVAKRESAVHVLENMGWVYGGCKWNKPVTPEKRLNIKPFSQIPLVAGGFATWDDKVIGGHVYVRSVGKYKCCVSWVSNVTLKGAHVSAQSFYVNTSNLIPRDRTYFIGK